MNPTLACYFCPWFSEARQTCIIEKPTIDLYIPIDCERWGE